MTPDLIIHNARIATCDARDTVASAMAIWRNRICAIGSDDDVLAASGPGARGVDLGGAFVCPGFCDCHVHLTSWALVAAGRRLDLGGTRSLAEALEIVRERVGLVPGGGWLRGRGWDKNRWAEARFPTAAELDSVTGDVPAALPSHDGHSLWANSAAMRAAGITQDTGDPQGGRILRDSGGHPTGVFQETALGLIDEHVPPASVGEVTEALREALPKAAALGLTAVHNCEGADALRATQNLRDSGELSLRVVQYVPAGLLDHVRNLGMRSGFGDEWLRIGGVKAFLDGALGAQTAAMLEPYDGSENSGVLTMSAEELGDLIRRATEARTAVALHAIGDRAVRTALDAFAEAKAEGEGPWPRHRIEHAQHWRPEDIARPAEAGVILSMQPAHLLADIDICERHIGARGRFAFPLRSLRDAGAKPAFGSDAPVETIDPLDGIRSAVLRRRRDGTPPEGWHSEERIGATEALRGYTIDAAFAGGDERNRGSLEVGKAADLVVLTHDLLAEAPEGLAEATVVGTVVGGRAVFDPRGLFR